MTQVKFQDDYLVKKGAEDDESADAELKSLSSEDAVSEEVSEGDDHGFKDDSNFYDDPADEIATVFSYTTRSAVLTSYADDEDDDGKASSKADAYLPRVAVRERRRVRIARGFILVAIVLTMAALPAVHQYVVKENVYKRFAEKVRNKRTRKPLVCGASQTQVLFSTKLVHFTTVPRQCSSGRRSNQRTNYTKHKVSFKSQFDDI